LAIYVNVSGVSGVWVILADIVIMTKDDNMKLSMISGNIPHHVAQLYVETVVFDDIVDRRQNVGG